MCLMKGEDQQQASFLPHARKEQLRHLAIQAAKNINNENAGETDNTIDLVLETCALQEVLGTAVQVGITLNFYENIDDAFRCLLDAKPERAGTIFETYRQLSSLFTIIERNKSIMDRKRQEMDQILKDLETLDVEGVDLFNC